MEELQPLKDSRTAILEKTEDISFEDSVVTEDKKEVAKKVLFENNSPERYLENLKKTSAISSTPLTASTPKFEFEAAKTFFIEPLQQVEKEIVEEPKISPEIEESVEIEESIEEQVSTEITEEAIDEVSQSHKPKVKQGLKARMKIIFFGFCAVLTCFCGWAIYNAVEISTLTAELEASSKTYGVNLVNYINNLAKADDLTSDSLINLQGLNDADIISIQPPALESPIEYSIKSNWFDRLCNWLSGSK